MGFQRRGGGCARRWFGQAADLRLWPQTDWTLIDHAQPTDWAPPPRPRRDGSPRQGRSVAEIAGLAARLKVGARRHARPAAGEGVRGAAAPCRRRQRAWRLRAKRLEPLGQGLGQGAGKAQQNPANRAAISSAQASRVTRWRWSRRIATSSQDGCVNRGRARRPGAGAAASMPWRARLDVTRRGSRPSRAASSDLHRAAATASGAASPGRHRPHQMPPTPPGPGRPGPHCLQSLSITAPARRGLAV